VPEKAFSVCIKDSVFIDPCCGSGGMFIQSAALVKAKQGDISRINMSIPREIAQHDRSN
jgi:type I restriction-modification system DNA methylase subunit